MTLEELIAQTEVELEAAQKRQQKAKAEIKLIIDTARQEGRANLTEEESVRADELFAHVDTAKADESGIKDKLARLTQLQAEEREADKRSREVRSTGAAAPQRRQAEVKIGREERTYHPGNDPRGTQFLRDVASTAISNDVRVAERLSRHMQEERVERGQYFERGTTGTYSGLVIPQYLVDMAAPAAAAMRPFADQCNKHPLPADGMQINVPKVTAASVGLQTTELTNTGIGAQDMSSNYLQAMVQTAAGTQQLSRQAVERGSGIEDLVLKDLFARYASSLDSTLITQATTGVSAASGAGIDPGANTLAALYSSVAAAASKIETNLLGYGKATHVVMNPRRWYWLASQMTTQWPFINSNGIPEHAGGTNENNQYLTTPRGVLPFGLEVLVDANVPVATAAGTPPTSADEIYVVCANECHLWEDSNAPVMIRAEQPLAGSLGILLVAYGYFAYTFQRYTGATQKLVSATNVAIPSPF